MGRPVSAVKHISTKDHSTVRCIIPDASRTYPVFVGVVAFRLPLPQRQQPDWKKFLEVFAAAETSETAAADKRYLQH